MTRGTPPRAVCSGRGDAPWHGRRGRRGQHPLQHLQEHGRCGLALASALHGGASWFSGRRLLISASRVGPSWWTVTVSVSVLTATAPALAWVHRSQALDAFLHLSRTGQAKDYDGKVKTYQFASKQKPAGGAVAAAAAAGRR